MNWKVDDYGISRLYDMYFTQYTRYDLSAIQAKEENLAVVAPQPDGKVFWRVFNDLAWRLPNEPDLTLLGLELEGYTLTTDEARGVCEKLAAEITRRGKQSNKDHLILAERKTRQIFRLAKMMLVAWLIAALLALIGAY